MMKQVSLPLCMLFLPVVFILLSQCSGDLDYRELIENGEFAKASHIIRQELATNMDLTNEQRLEMKFELERMERIKKDFTKTEEEILDYVRKYIPNVDSEDISEWEKSGALEYMIIDGEKKYFNNAAPNLFRIDEEAKKIKEEVDKEKIAGAESKKFPLDEHIAKIIEQSKLSQKRYVSPVTLKIKQSVTVHKSAVPDGEVIRCWIPFPREIPNRQVNIKLLNTEPSKYIIADNDKLQRTIYFEKVAHKDSTTEFSTEYQYTSYGAYVPIDPDKVKPAQKTEDLLKYISEEPPHIVFTDELIELSRSIVKDETNPYRIAQNLFEWVDQNIPWASAREYSTIYNIPEYVYSNRHGDCGMQTLFFMTLCRINGVPTKWQSGWEFQPPDDSMHDWGEIYFEPYGWLPVDVTYGMRDTDNKELKWFYLSGMDSYRLIFNDGYSQDFYPVKVHSRSETVDSQRGEVEWRGGNLYFDKWDWALEWEVISD